MNAADFYDNFKTALDFLGPGWRDMGQIKVTGKITLSFNSLEATIMMGKSLKDLEIGECNCGLGAKYNCPVHDSAIGTFEKMNPRPKK